LSHKDARVHCAVLKKRAAPHTTGAYHTTPTPKGDQELSVQRFDRSEGP